jgi:hypothetical protein
MRPTHSAVFSLWHFPPVARPGCYPALCPSEPGPSSAPIRLNTRSLPPARHPLASSFAGTSRGVCPPAGTSQGVCPPGTAAARPTATSILSPVLSFDPENVEETGDPRPMDAGLEVAGQVRDSTLSQPFEDRAAGLPESAPSAPQLSIHNRRIEHRSERAFPGSTPCAEVILIRPGSMYCRSPCPPPLRPPPLNPFREVTPRRARMTPLPRRRAPRPALPFARSAGSSPRYRRSARP